MKNMVKLFLILCFLLSTPLFAQTHVWTGNGGDLDWFNTSNWDAGTIPGDTSNVIISSGFVVEITSQAAQANSVQIEPTGMLIIQNDLFLTTSALIEPQGAFVFKEGLVECNGIITNNGTFKFNSPVVKRFRNATLENNGLILIAETNVTELLDVAINNNETGTLDIASVGGFIQQGNNSAINNKGLLRKRADGINPIGNFYLIAEIMNEGTIDVAQDEILLLLAGASDFINMPGGIIQGSGTLDITANFTSNGIISPAGDGGVGTLDFTNNFQLSSLNTLNIDINGTTSDTYDQIRVTGRPVLDGDIKILVNTNEIETGDQFTILTATNGISSCNLPDIVVEFDQDGDGLNLWEFNVICNGNSIVLEASEIALSVTDISGGFEDFFLYPNPAKETSKFNIPNTLTKENTSIVIYNIAGQKITQFEGSSEFNAFNAQELQSGIYFAQLVENNSVLATTRLIVR